VRSKTSCRLVIDASVARAAGGEEAGSPSSTGARDFLKAVLAVCHRVVMTPDIYKEWRKHWSRFASLWVHQMRGRKKVALIEPRPTDWLRRAVDSLEVPDRQHAALIKDAPLVLAALATDGRIASGDEEARSLFRHAAETVPPLRALVWVNPEHAEQERPIQWLRAGAPDEPQRRLGAVRKHS
jgi:hypothetical protein